MKKNKIVSYIFIFIIGVLFISCTNTYNFVDEDFSEKIDSTSCKIEKCKRHKGGFFSFKVKSNSKLEGVLCYTAIEMPEMPRCFKLYNGSGNEFDSTFLFYVNRKGVFRFDEWIIKDKGVIITEEWKAAFPRNKFSIESGKVTFLGTFSILKVKDSFSIEYIRPVVFDVPQKIENFTNKNKLSMKSYNLDIDFYKVKGVFSYRYYPGKFFLFWD